MSLFQTVSNWLLGEYKVRASTVGTFPNDSTIQHIRLDIGSGTTESQVTALNPLPTTATVVPSSASATLGQGNIAGSALTGSYQTVVTPGVAFKSARVSNKTDGYVDVSYDNGSNTHVTLEPGAVDLISCAFGESLPITNVIKAKQGSFGNAPASGTVYAVLLALLLCIVGNTAIAQPGASPVKAIPYNATFTPIATSSNPLRTDPTGTTTQPVSGTVTANQGGSWTNACTQSGTWNIGTVTTLTGITNVVHVDDNAGSLTVDGTVAATQSGTWNINNVSGTVSLPTGAATSANQSTEITSLQLIDDTVHATGGAYNKGLVVGGLDTSNLFLPFAVGKTVQLTAATNNKFSTAAVLFAYDGSTNFNALEGNTTNGLEVDVTRVQGTVTTSASAPVALGSVTHSTLGVTTSSQQALASNSSRRFAYIQNDSDTTIYCNLGSTAVANQGIRLNASGGYFEINSTDSYTGAINCIHGGTGTKTLLIGTAN